MTLQPGTRLGPYEIAAPLGAGGMGEVYRGRDTRLDRSVAIKVLPAEYAGNAQLRARLEREARAISSLNHPNVCTLYDVGSENGTDYLVMELIEGETLADRIARGRLPLPEALRHAIEIAGALDKAHRHGIVHRDLKPGNVMLTRTGAKLLDFGLSKPAPAMELVSPDSATRQMTEKPLTAEGTIVGTFQYMAPEQIEGRDADARTDIFAFGALLYEMLTGRRAFDAKTRTSMIAQILEREPPPVTDVQPMTPRSLDRIVRACLAKDPNDRFQTAHDVLLELRWIQEELSLPQAAVPVSQKSKTVAALPWVLLAAVTIVAGWLAATRYGKRDELRSIRAAVVAAPGTNLATTGDFGGGVTISPDGKHVAFVAVDGNARRHVFVRPIDTAEPRKLDATVDATFPFWSPDGKNIGFFAAGFLKTVDVTGGPAQTICRAIEARGGAWSRQGDILFSRSTRTPLSRVRAAGGEPQEVTKLGPAHSTHRWPVFLPDGNRFLYLAANHGDVKGADTGIYVGSLDGKEKERLLVRTLGSAVLAAGHLLFIRDNTLVAQPFDERTATLRDEAVPIARGVTLDLPTWRGIFDTVDGDLLVYQSGAAEQSSRLTIFDLTGKVLRQYPETAVYGDVIPSPDGKKLLMNIGDPQANQWLVDVETGQRTRLTFEQGFERAAVWTADGKEIFYTAAAGTRYSRIYRKGLNGGARAEVVGDPAADLISSGITRDEQWLLVGRYGPPHPQLFAYHLGERKMREIGPAEPILAASLSPTGDLFAYQALEEGTEHVYISTFPDGGTKWQASNTGGRRPVWSLDGNTLYFLGADDQLSSVTITRAADGISIGQQRTHFRLTGVHSAAGQPYAVLPDGRVLANITTSNTQPLTLLTNWSAALRK